MRITCACCCRQLVSDAPKNDQYVTEKRGAVSLGFGKVACGICAKEIDTETQQFMTEQP